MAEQVNAYVVESEAVDAAGVRRGTFRLFVASEARAREVAGQAPGRTWRALPLDEVPELARGPLAASMR